MSEEKNTQVLNLETLNVSNLPELQGWKDKQETLVKENPFIEITDNKTFEVAKQYRTALLKGRTSLESQEKAIASKLSSFRKDVGAETKKLIDITLPHENKQQEEVKRFEQIKENERLERERLEAERVATIKAKIEELESNSYLLINKWDYSDVKDADKTIFTPNDEDFDFEEFDILWQQAKERVQKVVEDKVKYLNEKEVQRIENERLKAEKEESDRKLKEMQDKADAEKKEAELKLKAIEDAQKAEKEASDKKLRDLELKAENERKEREAKELEEKKQMFEIRKSRLAEIGMVQNEGDWFSNETNDSLMNLDLVMNSSSLSFEEAIKDAKNAIQIAKEKAENEAEAELKRQADLKSENEAKEKAEILRKKQIEKENKARVKRLSNDKKIIAESLETYFADLHLESENQETKDFIDSANVQIQSLKSILLTQLNDL